MIKTITGAEPAGYSLNMLKFSELIVTSTGSVGGAGVYLNEAGTVVNAGKLLAGSGGSDNGIRMESGGVVSNSGSISGYLGIWGRPTGHALTVTNTGMVSGDYSGIVLDSGGVVVNYGVIKLLDGTIAGQCDAVLISSGTVENYGSIISSNVTDSQGNHSGVTIGQGEVKNGTYSGSSALITGYYGLTAVGATTVANYGVIRGVKAGVHLQGAGSLTNGDLNDTSALIDAQITGVTASAASVYNFGSIQGGLSGVVFGGSRLNNGAPTDLVALIEGGDVGVRTTKAASNIYNFATIETTVSLADYAVSLDGGALTNGAASDTSALLEGPTGVYARAGGTVTNYGRIDGSRDGATFSHGAGRLTNGSSSSRTAFIEGVYFGVEMISAAGSVGNFATILTVGGGGTGVDLTAGGTVTNGAVDDQSAEINGSSGVQLGAAGTVVNYGRIDGATGDGVNLAGGGALTNGAPIDPGALIEGLTGLVLAAPATVANFGTIESSGKSAAVNAMAGGMVTNGAGGDPTALLIGANGVTFAGAAGSVVNYATITGVSGDGVLAAAGGSVVNGGGADRAALIKGLDGVVIGGAAGAVANFATIIGAGGSGAFGLYLEDGGSLTNGTINDRVAVVEGYGGARLLGAGASTNFGTIEGLGATALSFGVDLGGNASLTNGAATDRSALIEGYFGAQLDAGGTLTNFGTISGANGLAVSFTSPTATLVVEAGSVFDGQVEGGGGTLDLANGVGTLSGLAAGDVTVSGSMAATSFTHFNTIKVVAGATFTAAGAVTNAAGQSLIDVGTLTLSSAVSNAGVLGVVGGVLTIKGAVSGTGTVRIGGGVADFASTFGENVFFGAAGVLELSHSQTYAGAISGFSKTGTNSLDLLDIAFNATTTKATFSGTAASGTLTVTDGTRTAHIALTGNYVGSTFTPSTDGHGGTTIVDPSPHRFIAAAAGFGAQAAGSIALSTDAWRPPPWSLTHSRPSLA